jgi:uncharacterized protein
MSLVIDTNILVHAVHAESPHHRTCKEFVEERKGSPGFFVTWSILYEWLRVVTHPRVFAHPLPPEAARDFVLNIARDSTVDVLPESSNHARILSAVLAEAPPIRGNLYHDVHIASVMREHGISTIATADRHFRLFPSLKVIDPTAL